MYHIFLNEFNLLLLLLLFLLTDLIYLSILVKVWIVIFVPNCTFLNTQVNCIIVYNYILDKVGFKQKYSHTLADAFSVF